MAGISGTIGRSKLWQFAKENYSLDKGHLFGRRLLKYTNKKKGSLWVAANSHIQRDAVRAAGEEGRTNPSCVLFPQAVFSLFLLSFYC
jgi:hypothetical protein